MNSLRGNKTTTQFRVKDLNRVGLTVISSEGQFCVTESQLGCNRIVSDRSAEGTSPEARLWFVESVTVQTNHTIRRNCWEE